MTSGVTPTKQKSCKINCIKALGTQAKSALSQKNNLILTYNILKQKKLH